MPSSLAITDPSLALAQHRRVRAGPGDHRHRDAGHLRPRPPQGAAQPVSRDARRRHDRARLGRLRRLGPARAGRRVPHQAHRLGRPGLHREPARRAGPRQKRSAQAPQVVLAVGAHPDDVEIGVGGILAAHRDAGNQVVILTHVARRAGRGRRTTASTSRSPRPSCSARGCSWRTSRTRRSPRPTRRWASSSASSPRCGPTSSTRTPRTTGTRITGRCTRPRCRHAVGADGLLLPEPVGDHRLPADPVRADRRLHRDQARS